MNKATSISLLETCSTFKFLKHLHAHMITLGLLRYTYITSRILSFYTIHDHMNCARKIFDSIPHPTIFVWNTMIRGYSKSTEPSNGLSIYKLMRCRNVGPNMHTFPLTIKACDRLSTLSQLHGQVFRFGFDTDVYVTSSLMKGYADVGGLELASMVFDQSSNRNIVCWTSLITGYCGHGLVDRARQVFDGMPERNDVSWSAMITGYVRHGHPEEAIELFRNMRACGSVKLNNALFVGVLGACASLGAYKEGRWVHAYIDGQGVGYSLELGTSLVDFYSKCGFVEKAREVFGKMRNKDVVAWSTMMMGLALSGHCQSAMEMFSEMLRSNVKPNHVTFLGLLTACNHGGLIDQGWAYFKDMSMVYGVSYKIEHYSCMVDMLSRAGRTAEAERLIRSMPMELDAAIWGALLNGCMMHGHDKLGEIAGRHVIQLEPQHCGRYVGVANVYAATGNWEGVGKVRSVMRERRVVTTPGWSSIEVNGVHHRFFVHDKVHPQGEKIYRMLDDVNLKPAPQNFTNSFD